MDKRFVGYIRVSDTRGREETLISDEVQKADILAYAQLLKGTVVEWRTDLDRTGRNVDREGFLEAVDLVESGAVDGLIVARLNRFARNVGDAAAFVARIEKHGVFASAHERLDNTPYGKFTRNLFFSMAELESDIIAQQWRTAQRMAIEEGRSVTPWAPAGFELVAEPTEPNAPKPKRVPKWLVPHPIYAPLVAEVFERRSNGATLRECADFMNRHEVPNARGRRHWTVAQVRRTLIRRTYIGELRHGDAMTVHESLAIVDREVFERVQQRRVVREPSAPRASGYLLSGIARCAGCGHALRGHRVSAAMVRSGTNPDYYYYRCPKHHSGGVCTAVGHAGGVALEAFAIDRLFEIVEDMQAENLGSSDELDDALAVREDALAELAAYVALESALGEHYLAGFQAKETTVREAEGEVDAIRARSGASSFPPVAKLRDEFDNWPQEDKRKLFAMVAPCVMVRNAPRLTPVERRALCIPRDRIHEVDLPSRGNGKDAPILRTFTWSD